MTRLKRPNSPNSSLLMGGEDPLSITMISSFPAVQIDVTNEFGGEVGVLGDEVELVRQQLAKPKAAGAVGIGFGFRPKNPGSERSESSFPPGARFHRESCAFPAALTPRSIHEAKERPCCRGGMHSDR